MAHPFAKQFEKALSKSSLENNLVYKEAIGLIEKGYSREEVCLVLSELGSGRISDTETIIVNDACTRLEEDMSDTNFH